MTLIYLHGFASDGGGWKAAALQQFFPQARVLSPDLPADPAAVVELLHQLASATHDDCYWFGTSLGGFYAYYASSVFQQPAFLFNPSLRPDETLRPRGIGHWKTFQQQRDYVFQADYLDRLTTLRLQAEAAIHQELLYFFLAEDDLILDLHPLVGQFPSAAHLSWYPECGHSFSKFGKAIKLIRQEKWIPLSTNKK